MSANREPWLAAHCLRLVDAGFLGILFIAPLFFGGRHDFGRLVFVLLSIVVALAWCGRQIALGGGTRTRTPVHGILGLAIGLILLQLLPMPERWLELLSPRVLHLLPLWTSAANSTSTLGAWHTLSLTPETTRLALVMLLGYGMLLVTAIERFRQLADIERLLQWIALASIGMGAFGLLQYFASNGLFFWFYELPYKSTDPYALGSFGNRNHFAHFLVLGTGPLLAWIVRAQGGSGVQAGKCNDRFKTLLARWASMTTVWLVLGLAIIVFATLLSLSRGGGIAMGAALLTVLILFFRAGQASSNTLLWAGGLALLMLAALSIYGYEKVAGRLDEIAIGSLEEIDANSGRRTIWHANLAAIQAGGWFGAGAGSHRDIYRVYLEEPHAKEYTHAENGYLQLLTENGILGGLLLLLALGTLVLIGRRSLRSQAAARVALCAGAVLAGLVASLVHSVVDFVWFIPACMSMTLLLVACAINLSRLRLSGQCPMRAMATTSEVQVEDDLLPRVRDHTQGASGLTGSHRGSHASGERQAAGESGQHAHKASEPWQVPVSRERWLVLGAVTLSLGVWMTSTLMGPAVAALHWDRYQRASIASTEYSQFLFRSNQQHDPQAHATQMMYQAEMFSQLQDVVRWHPRSARAHLRLASQYLQKFEQAQQHQDNAMGISQIRDAAMASEFPSSQALRDWLARAFGENYQYLYQAYRHAWTAVKLDPLQGNAYMHLANLCFLAGCGQEAIEAYVEQSLRVRPQNTNVLYEAGIQEILQGRADQAIALWTRAFRSPGKHQLQIIQQMAGQIPAATFMEVFRPDWHTLDMLWQRYREQGQRLDLEVLAQYAAGIAESPQQDQSLAKRVHAWISLAMMQNHLEENGAALVSLQHAYQLAPNNYYVHRSLATTLLELKRFQDAEKHIRWCLARRPNDQSLRAARIQTAENAQAAHHQTW